ncbi:MAG: universal stress protein [bacterium]
MKKILLILSFLRSSPKTIATAIGLAKKMKAELLVFFVLDIEYAEKIVHKLTDEGWIGGKPSDQLYDSLLKEYKLQAEETTLEIEKMAKEQHVPVRSIIRSGSLATQSLRLAHLEKPDLILITRRKRSNLSRLIFGSAVKTIQEQAPCDVKIIDAE